ncbi:PAPS1 [Symbiodinium natans]|uniref:PAPS1 protein n=1 Tax=Symbiodinium natans TaxID=878477 RepID=A0A812I1F0_9DINO|nr:PAPS1 [Symbiodinium natans]
MYSACRHDFGYLGGTSWAICSALVCQTEQHQDLEKLFGAFFDIMSSTPASMKPSVQRGNAGLKVMLPVGSNLCANPNLTASAAQQLQKEFRRGNRMFAKIQQREADWKQIFSVSKFFERYYHYLQFDITASSEEIMFQWLSWCRQHLQGIADMLETGGNCHLITRPWPEWMPFKDCEWHSAIAHFIALRVLPHTQNEAEPEGTRPVIDLREILVTLLERLCAWPLATEHFGEFDLYIRHTSQAEVKSWLTALDGGFPVKRLHRCTQTQVLEKLAESMSVICEKEKSTLPRLAEEDLVQFMVKLSVEGFPQAVKVRRMQKYSGTVVRAPEWINESPESPWKPGTAVCAEVARDLGGTGEVLLLQSNCGQIRFQSGDRVTFCLPKASEDGYLPEAKLVMLSHTDRPAGSVLSCCRLHLPRPLSDGKQPAPLNLDLHAFSSKVVLSGLSIDVGEAELMRFFSKQGATKGIVAHARGCSFASITFPSCVDVATFLGRSAHAFADDKETRIALLLNRSPIRCPAADEARLPALPAPTIRPGEAPASIFVNWAPLQLALGYASPCGGASSSWDEGALRREEGEALWLVWASILLKH